MKTLTVEDIAALLHMSVRTIHNKLYRDPGSLPPRLEVPGMHKVLWLESDVHAWLLAARKEAA
jgi:predicted DNA-binding transcriptional regulator AlpA